VPRATSGPRLSEAQRRHLIELYGDGEQTLYWHAVYGSPQHRTITVLVRLGLLKSEGYGYGQGWFLTDEGRRVAAELAAKSGTSR
jgi:hypothetical protein